ncbi:MAG: thioredoxin family protein [Planctomycetota bacterium]
MSSHVLRIIVSLVPRNRMLRQAYAVSLVGFVATILLSVEATAASVAQAIQQSQRTGKPIFAVAGASYCPSCVRLMKTLNTDESLRPYIEQFIPLKIDAQSDDYKRWKQFFPPKKSAIPALFIVTPRGEEVYSAVGALPTTRLRKVMLTSLEKAERYPTKEQWSEIGETFDLARRSLDEGDYDQAAELLLPTLETLARMGSLLQLGDEGSQIVATIDELAAKQRTLLEGSLQVLISKGDLESALEVASLEQMLGALAQQHKTVTVEINRQVRDAEQKKTLRQARELRQAKVLALQSNAKQQRKAAAIYKRIVKRYPDSEASTRARQQLQAVIK